MLPDSPRVSIFIDRNSGGRTLREILTAAGLHVVLHDDEFDQTTPDHEWLKANGDAKRLIVSGDNRTTRDLTFLRQLKATKAHVFILLGLNGASREAKAQCILDALDLMLRYQSEYEPPALFRVQKDGKKAHHCDHEKTLGRAHVR